MQPQTKKLIIDTAYIVATQLLAYYGIRYFLASRQGSGNETKNQKERGKVIAKRLNLSGLKLNEYESIIMGEVILPEDVPVTFNQIGGLDDIVEELNESVIYPLNHPELFTSASGLLGSPKGILLYGPPGCGKTMMAKALARESGAVFINLHLSTLQDKWFGESNRLIRAVFTLAEKLQPSIVFIDEIDAFLKTRASTEHEVSSTMKAEFMSLWDGLTSAESSRVVVLGATNRPNDIDSAIIRRMPKQFYIKPPTMAQRKHILQIMLKKVDLDDSFSIDELVKATKGFSGSDLKELCRNAAIKPLREYIRENPVELRKLREQENKTGSDASSYPSQAPSGDNSGRSTPQKPDVKLRPLRMDDFEIPEKNKARSLSQAYNLQRDISRIIEQDMD